MIIGNGLIAKSLQEIDTEEVVYFASGVSNSQETNPSEFAREFNLLKEVFTHHTEKKIVYFSSCSISDPSKKISAYVLHKLNLEKWIQENCKNYCIIRIGNAVGNGGNPHTIFNFLRDQIQNNQEITVHQNARRIFIDTEDIACFLKNHLGDYSNEIINLAYPFQYKIIDLIQEIETYLKIKSQLKMMDEGSPYEIVFDEGVQSFFQNKMNEKEYLRRLIIKYL